MEGWGWGGGVCEQGEGVAGGNTTDHLPTLPPSHLPHSPPFPPLPLPQARPIWFSPQQDIAFLKVDPASIPYPDAVAPLASWTTFAADHAVADGDFAPVLSVGSPGSFAFA